METLLLFSPPPRSIVDCHRYFATFLTYKHHNKHQLEISVDIIQSTDSLKAQLQTAEFLDLSCICSCKTDCALLTLTSQGIVLSTRCSDLYSWIDIVFIIWLPECICVVWIVLFVCFPPCSFDDLLSIILWTVDRWMQALNTWTLIQSCMDGDGNKIKPSDPW